ncbi:MAG: N-acetyltransferase [Saprospiraceae bacterium]|nr:N-acetyltransferase [Saprospiraceae bacterium]MBK9727517.1 N-acetyltransferase [Saprospiraceae bacterium]
MYNNFEIRFINETDTQAVLDIYKYYVDHTIISFEYEAPTLEEYRERIRISTEKYPWLICLCNNKIIGFAYGSTYRYRNAYQWSSESSIYIAPDFHTKGIGRILYMTLLELLKLQGYFNVFAGVALPNEKSVGFHRTLGFKEIGFFKKVGYKHGNWHDIHWFQLHLTDNILNPPTPKTINAVLTSSAFQTILTNANERTKNIK